MKRVCDHRLDVQIRWMIRRDMVEVLRIEQASPGDQWDDEEFLCHLRQRNCIGMVAEHNHKIRGFMIYELHKTHLQVLRFAVHPEHRRRNIGYQMVCRLHDKLSPTRRDTIEIEVDERNLDFHLFLKAAGFVATDVMRGGESPDIYQFKHTVSDW